MMANRALQGAGPDGVDIAQGHHSSFAVVRNLVRICTGWVNGPGRHEALRQVAAYGVERFLEVDITPLPIRVDEKLRKQDKRGIVRDAFLQYCHTLVHRRLFHRVFANVD